MNNHGNRERDKLPPCAVALYRDGEVVGIYAANNGAREFESCIVRLRAALRCEIDWYFAGGRAVVKAWPADADRVRAALADD